MTFDDDTFVTRATSKRSGEDRATTILWIHDHRRADRDLRVDVRRQLAARYRLLEAGGAMAGLRLACRYQPEVVIRGAGTAGLDGYVPCRGLTADTVALSLEEQAFLQRMEALIADHLDDDDFDTAVLTRQLATSRTKLYQSLRHLAGCSPAELIMERRLERAAKWLAEGVDSVSKVAFGVGFKSVSHFSRRFKQRYGIRPSVLLGRAASTDIVGDAENDGNTKKRIQDAQAKLRDVQTNATKAGSLV